MKTLQHLRRLFEYNLWANRRAFESLGSLEGSEGGEARALRAFLHLLVAEREWALRLEESRDTTGFNFWPDPTREACSSLLDENLRSYASLLGRLSEEDLARTATYKNSKGVAYTTSYLDILTHVAFHSAYHRGQVASAVRESGGTPAYTDFVGWQRETEGA
jgi:uncharacterized damage-inducible protein DinB